MWGHRNEFQILPLIKIVMNTSLGIILNLFLKHFCCLKASLKGIPLNFLHIILDIDEIRKEIERKNDKSKDFSISAEIYQILIVIRKS